MASQYRVDMTGLQTVPCHIAGMVLGIVLLEDKIASNGLIDRNLSILVFLSS